MKTIRNKKTTTIIILCTLLLALLFPLVQSQIEHPTPVPSWDNLNWWNTEWPYRKLLSINHTTVSEDLINFPVLFSQTSDPDLAAKAQPNGFDIVFVSYDDNTTALYHEIEFYNSSNGQLIAWINTPQVSSTTDTKLWMYYGNPDCGDQQQVEDTWDASYLAVHHLEETADTVYDSTMYNNDGTPSGDLNQDVTGQIDGADFFDGIDDKILLPSVYTTENEFTIETWIYAQTGARHFISQRSDTAQGIFIQVTSDNSLQYYINSFSYITGLALNTWYYLALVYNGTTASLYLNGFDSAVACSPPTWPAVAMCLGNRPAGDRPFHGTMDEVRFSNIARTSGWIATTYENQHNPGTFISTGSEEPYEYILTLTVDPAQGGTIDAVPLPPYYYNDNVTLTAIPNQGYLFDYWSGNLTGNQNPTSITMDANKAVTANFIIENMPPIAENDTATVQENSTNNTIDVLANDYDPDGDPLTIDSVTQPLYGVSSHDGSYAYYTPNVSYIGEDSFTYKITDGQGGTASATVFLTVEPTATNNTPPYKPSQPIPDDGETNVNITTDLWWTGGDPDPDDSVLYDVYFGTNTTPVVVSQNQSENTYDPGVLNYDTTYYWRIVSWDTSNASTEGDLWMFTTQSEAGELTVTITKPLENSFYLRNRRLISLPRQTIVYGPITITAEVTSDASVDRVEFYIDGKLKVSDDAAPYSYRWAPVRCFKHDIMVKAYDTNNQVASDEITVFKWRLHPLLIAAGWIIITTH